MWGHNVIFHDTLKKLEIAPCHHSCNAACDVTKSMETNILLQHCAQHEAYPVNTNCKQHCRGGPMVQNFSLVLLHRMKKIT